MTRIMVLATALALLPAFALANTSQPSSHATPPAPAVRIAPACTPVNPCAVPPPAISSLDIWRRDMRKDRAAPQAR